MKKNILVISYSQTGQLTAIVESFLSGFSNKIHIDYIKLDEIYNYKFPWSMQSFFGVFPDSVLKKTESHFMLDYDEKYDKKYDLVILGYQPWFLSPSIPISTFLQSDFAKKILPGKAVITIIGCRNMWTQAQETVKGLIKDVNAHWVGNITLYDKAYNFVSLFTILRWMLRGQKGNSGVNKKDIEQNKIYGKYVNDVIIKNEPIAQQALVNLGAVKIIPHLALMEKRAFIIFLKFAQLIDKEKKPLKKKFKIKLFQLYLIIAILIFSPISMAISLLIRMLHPKKYKEIINYYAGLDH
ncbi:MAG: hypothetical protein LEGION0403_FIIPPAGN_00063 [Legionella sp.]|uniref:hypothetical protein n=1 Tax=Legionella sp. TaxID=459 RepID=UPI003D0E177A